jgi:hypothetical protein
MVENMFCGARSETKRFVFLTPGCLETETATRVQGVIGFERVGNQCKPCTSKKEANIFRH